MTTTTLPAFDLEATLLLQQADFDAQLILADWLEEQGVEVPLARALRWAARQEKRPCCKGHDYCWTLEFFGLFSDLPLQVFRHLAHSSFSGRAHYYDSLTAAYQNLAAALECLESV